MRRRDPIRIGDALNDFFTSTPTIARKIAEARIPDVWPRVVGDIVASYTVRLEIKTGGRLFVYLSSSVVRNEIFMQRAALCTRMNSLHCWSLICVALCYIKVFCLHSVIVLSVSDC